MNLMSGELVTCTKSYSKKTTMNTAQNMPNNQTVGSREWVIKAKNRPWKGWCPFAKVYMTHPILYGETPDYALAKHLVAEPDIIRRHHGVWHGQLPSFVARICTESLSSIARFSGYTDRFFFKHHRSNSW